MRKIVMTGDVHNRTRSIILGLVVFAASVMIGCGGGDATTETAPRGRTITSTTCPLVVTDHAMQAVCDLADRVASGDTVSLEDMGREFSKSALDRWRRSFTPDVLPAAWTARMLFTALVGREHLPPRFQAKPVQMDLVSSYTESIANRTLIQRSVDTFIDDDLGCRVHDVLDKWIAPGTMPDTLRIDFVIGLPEIRLFEDRILLDAGLAWAAGYEQLPRFIASALYSRHAAFPGTDPDQAHGEAIVFETLRLIVNTGVPAYLDQMPDLVFDKRYRLLAGSSPNAESVCKQAYLSLRSLDDHLEQVRHIAEPTDENWDRVYRLFVGAQSWQSTGWFMCQTVADRLGESRLRATGGHPADLIEAYAEACGVEHPSASGPPQTRTWYLAHAPALSDDNLQWLLDGMRAYFQ